MDRPNITSEVPAPPSIKGKEGTDKAVNHHHQPSVVDTEKVDDTIGDHDQPSAKDSDEFNDTADYYTDPPAVDNGFEQATPSIPLVPIYPTSLQPNFDYRLPIPSPLMYHDQYHTPLFPLILPPSNCFVDPINQPYKFPHPFGPLKANDYNLHGLQLHDFGYVNFNPHKLFTKYLLWYLEITDDLFRRICPSDLNDIPCEWDELQGGCQMLRLCETKHKYPHPHLGLIPDCTPKHLIQCRYIHDITPSCRSIARQLQLPREKQFYAQLCDVVVDAEICPFGHDFESARVEAVERYWVHWEEARGRGGRGVVKRDVLGRKLLYPIRPFVE